MNTSNHDVKHDHQAQQDSRIDDPGARAEALKEKLQDAQIPGYEVEFDPEEAAKAGAFIEDALNEGDAKESDTDLA